jgi:hypothetical protein
MPGKAAITTKEDNRIFLKNIFFIAIDLVSRL